MMKRSRAIILTEEERRELVSQHNGAFVAAMEDVLAVYGRPYNENYPVVCTGMPATPLHLLSP
jgi:hypothetical protein